MTENLFAKDIIKTEDPTTSQSIFLSKIKLKSSINELIEYYTKNKDSINLIKYDNDKNLPLQIAVSNKNYEAVKLIISKFNNKSDINLQNSLGWSALHTSCALSGTEEITTLLINNGAEINLLNKNKQTPLHICCGKNRIGNLKVLLSFPNIDINPIDYNGFTPLIKACASLAYDAVKILINEIGIKLNIKDNMGNTALHYIFEDNNYELGIKMIQIGANYEIQNNEHKIPFDKITDNDTKQIIISYLKSKKENEKDD